MAATLSVQDWFQIIQHMDDTRLAKELLNSLTSYQGQYHNDIEQVVALLTAVRLDQMAKEIVVRPS